MILSRSTAPQISTDTSPSSSARPHLSTSSLLKFKRHQDVHGSFRRTWGKFHPAKKDLILCAAAEASEPPVNMSLKTDAEPNNNVSIEEEVSFHSFCVPPDKNFFSPLHDGKVRFCRSKCVFNASRLFRRCPEVVCQERRLKKGPTAESQRGIFTWLFLGIYSLLLSARCDEL